MTVLRLCDNCRIPARWDFPVGRDDHGDSVIYLDMCEPCYVALLSKDFRALADRTVEAVKP